MACNNTLQTTLNWALPFFRFSPQLTGSLEPALSNANLVKQTILGPPFRWRQNRGVMTFTTVSGQQDYSVGVTDFGFLEQASVTDPYGNTYQIEDDGLLSATSEQGRPAQISVQQDDNAGNLIFRLQPCPDQVYSASLTYQRKAVPMSSVVSAWAPLPDELSYIYNWGYLAMAAQVSNDGRAAAFSQKFVGHLLGAQDGISDLARNIFLNNWLQVQSQAQRTQQTTQQGITARTF